MAIAVEKFSRQLVESGVLSEEDLRQFIDGIPAGERPVDGEQLARRLVKSKLISAYQAQLVYSGKGKQLTLGGYFILDKLGQGGMGMVLKAEHRRMKRLVAIKVLSPTVTRTKDLQQRFQREVEAAARLTHPNIVGAFDAGESNGAPFLVMEYVRGDDLSSIVKQNGPLSVEQAIDCILQAARGLEYAHEQGVIHRDIKPANLLLDTEGIVKILDMGLARIDSADVQTQADLTGTGTVMGTVDYMAPEQAVSTKHADARSDLYSLGISLWFLLIGKAAYEGDSIMARLLAHREQPIPSLCKARGDVPESLDTVFRKLVAKLPADRYQTARELIADLLACRTGASLRAVPVSEVGTGTDEFQRFLDHIDSQAEGPRSGRSQSARSASKTIALAQPSVDAAEETIPPSGAIDTRRFRQKLTASVPSPPWYRDRRVLLGAGAALALLLVLGVVILVRSPLGTLRVEIFDPEIELTVQGTDLSFHGTDLEPVSIQPGEKKLLVSRGDLSFETEAFEIRRGKETRVRVEVTGDKVVVEGGGKVIAEQVVGRPRAAASPARSNRTEMPDGSSGSASAKDVRTAEASAGAIDLMAKFQIPDDAEKHAVFGDWTWDGKTLISPGEGKAGRIEVRHPVPTNYELTAVVERVTGDDGVLFLLPVGDRKAEVGFDVYYPRISGITTIDGKSADDNEVTFREKVLADLKRHTIRIVVTPPRLLATVDGREIIRWEGDSSRLAPGLPSRHLKFGAAYHQFRFYKLELRALESQTSTVPQSAPDPGRARTPPPRPRDVADRPAEAPAPAIAPFTAIQAAAFQDAWARYLGLPVEFTNSLGMRFRLIPPGEFEMGCNSEEIDALHEKMPSTEEFRRRFLEGHAASVPRHTVRITRPFYMQVDEVRNGLFQTLLGRLPEQNDPEKPDQAVMRNVSLLDAVAFCNAVSRREERTPAYQTGDGQINSVPNANGYRLPTEAEWEYACRAGTTGFYFLEDDLATLANLAILREYQSMHVGERVKPNPFGLLDQYGGSSEWCFDCFVPYEAGTVSDPFVEPGDGMGVVRGGAEFASGGIDPAQVNSLVRAPSPAAGPVNQYYGFGRVVLPIEME